MNGDDPRDPRPRRVPPPDRGPGVPRRPAPGAGLPPRPGLGGPRGPAAEARRAPNSPAPRAAGTPIDGRERNSRPDDPRYGRPADPAIPPHDRGPGRTQHDPRRADPAYPSQDRHPLSKGAPADPAIPPRGHRTGTPQRDARRTPPPDFPGANDPTVSAHPRHIEPTAVLRRDGSEPRPLAYSQMAKETSRAEPAYQPTQRPEPFREAAPPPPPPTRQPRRAAPPPAAPPAKVKRRRKRHPFRWFLAILLLLVIGIVAAVFHLDGKLTRIDALANYADRVGDTPGTNWLLVGSDGRGGLSPDQERDLSTGGDTGPERTDTIILVHIPKSGATTMVSLPRDSYVSIPGYGRDKLNAAFAFGGPQLLVQTVEIATGLRIDNYAQIGFAGFAGIVDALGGIDVCVPNPIDDPLAGINLPAGCQELNGAEALGFVRSRATALADIDRMNNQRLFMAALLEKATSGATLANPFRLWPLATGMTDSLKVDEGDHLWDIARLGWAMRGDTVATTVPIAGFEDVSGSGNVLMWDKTRAGEFFAALAEDRPVPEALLTR